MLKDEGARGPPGLKDEGARGLAGHLCFRVQQCGEWM